MPLHGSKLLIKPLGSQWGQCSARGTVTGYRAEGMVKLLPSFIYNSGKKGKGHQGFDSLSPLQLSDYLVSRRVQWNLRVLIDLQAFLLFIRRNQTCENIPALIPSGRAVIFH